MKSKMFFVIVSIALVAGLSTGRSAAQEPVYAVLDNVGPAFTYQGYLEDYSGAVEGACDFQFSLWNMAAGGQQSGSMHALTAVPVTVGRFTVVLNDADQFGPSPFDGQARWLAISVRCPAGGGSYVSLEPRQLITVSPYAAYSMAAPWSGLSGLPAGFADNVDDDTLAMLSCANGEIPEWGGTQWVCGTDDIASGGGGGDITAVYAGTGLSGGGLSGDVTLTADTTYLQERVDGSCPAGSSIRLINQDGTVSCETDDDSGGDVTSVSAGTGLSGGGDAGDVNLSLLTSYQLPQSCTNGQIAEWDGAVWNCGADDVGTGSGSGDVTAVYAGTGLSGGGDTGDLTLSVDTTYVQRRVSNNCAAGSSIRSIGQDGSVVCETDSNSGGDITAVNAGTGLNGGGTSGAVTVDVDTGYVQRRVSSSCSAGSSIRTINSNGTVLCETDDQNAYTAGHGLVLSGYQFSADFDYLASGSSYQVARSDHDHLGQTWTGSNIPLKIEGGYGNTNNNAPLVLSNNNGNGVLVKSAQNGIKIDYASDNGLYVSQAVEDGLFVSQAGNTTASASQPGSSNGVEIASATGSGMFVGHAGENGLDVWYAAENGIVIEGAAYDGLHIGSATRGVGIDGIHIDNATDDGLQIGYSEYPNYGVYIPSSGVEYTALLVNTANPASEWALYTTDKISALNVTFSSLTLLAKVDVGSQLSRGDVVAASGVAEPLPDSLDPLPLVRPADSERWNGVIGVVESRMVYQLAPGKEEEGEMILTSVSGMAKGGDYVALRVYGVAEVKVDGTVDVLEPGQRLTISEESGRARALQTRLLEGMVVTEGGPVIGIVLASLEPGQETVPVFVNLR